MTSAHEITKLLNLAKSEIQQHRDWARQFLNADREDPVDVMYWRIDCTTAKATLAKIDKMIDELDKLPAVRILGD